ncbi:hypothetical protein M378DRAFT_160401 [Amanita muscaria Koide BX008]|uniref:Uncharacterized protein n=1 Tax=Amanita muscaria (strain Koide BX008) TaxID=946122 RepID=A0A0C2TIR9_AMAMK|nr:hypothetical protein M378DRAFT_160401 [Amanita muscaria Koide BX008]
MLPCTELVHRRQGFRKPDFSPAADRQNEPGPSAYYAKLLVHPGPRSSQNEREFVSGGGAV